jgi:gliding motility-associated-like protein
MGHKLRYLFLAFFLLTSSFLVAQKEANIWYFGSKVGLDFNSGVPVALNDGKTVAQEGVATISNSNGNLLFYTDGITVWNRQHQVMVNGTGLLGHTSSTQSGVIVPMIGDPSRYYIFTMVDVSGTSGLHYSVVNMNLDNGNGDVEVKNIPLMSNATEKLAAVRHCNNRDIWVIVHHEGSYYSFLVSPSGVSLTPVISNTGSFVVATNNYGYLKPSPDGRKIASAVSTEGLDISDFDDATGVVSNSINLVVPSDTLYKFYGVEFSPDGKLIYATTAYKSISNPIIWGQVLIQFDNSLSSPAAIRASRQVISNSLRGQFYAALQLGPDGKMYTIRTGLKGVDVINDPNVFGPGCDYVQEVVRFYNTGQLCLLGLPTFIQSYFYPPDSFTYKLSCPGNVANFQCNPSSKITSLLWKFGDPASGNNNTSTQQNPSHIFSAAGSYTIQLIEFTACGSDTISKTIQIGEQLSINLGADTTLCRNDTLALTGQSVSATQYLWQDGSTSPTYSVKAAGMYWLELRDSMGCVKRDSINIYYKDKPQFSLGPDEMICPGNSVVLNPAIDPAWQLQWNDGVTNAERTVANPGVYKLTASNFCGAFSDEVIISKGACKVYIPTAFTPNQDGTNDLFRALGVDLVTSFHLKIFNRWGEMIFETKDKTKGWNGRYKRAEADTGVYIYVLEFVESISPEQQYRKGTFLLIR